MNATVATANGTTDVLPLTEAEQSAPKSQATAEAWAELKRSVLAALGTYSNVHRGSGHYSLVSTRLYEQAREIVLDYLGLDQGQYVVIFCTPRRAERLTARLAPKSYQSVSSQDVGLPLGVRALAVNRRVLPKGIPLETGGGTARLVFPDQVIWAKAPDTFEAGTPAIVNVIALAQALRLIEHFGPDAFRGLPTVMLAAADILGQDALEPYSGRELLEQLRQTLIGRGLQVPTMEGPRPYINLDNAASTRTFTPIWDAVCQTWRQPAPVQQEIIREARAICARLLGAPLADYEVIFTSNTTEAINLAAESFERESESGLEPVVLNTLMEHNSNELPWRTVLGVTLLRLPVDAEGFVDLNELESVMGAYNQAGQHGQQRITLMAVSGASNVLGVFNNLAQISRIVHRHGARLLVDAAQLVAHRPVDMAACGIDYLAFSAHKAYAPFGSGVLVVKKGLLRFSPAELERIQASGEENVGGIAALGKALRLLQRIGLDVIQDEEQVLAARALRGLAAIPGLTIYGVKDPDSPRFAQKGGVIVFGMKDLMPDRVAKALAERGGIGVRYGCHCAHLLVKHLLNVGPRLATFQGLMLNLLPQIALPGLVRVSLGLENTAAEVDTFVQVLGQIAQQPRAGTGRSAAAMPAGTRRPPQGNIKQQMDDFAREAALRVYTQLE